MKKTALVIGSSSFSGSWFVKKLIDKKFKVIGLSRSKIKKEYNFINSKKFIFYKIDLNKNFKKITQIIEKINLV